MKRVMALDPSSSVIGYCCMSYAKNIIEAGRICSRNGDDWDIVRRVDTMLGDLRKTLVECCPDEVVIEIPAPQSPPMQHGNRGQANYGVAVGLVIGEVRRWAMAGPPPEVPVHFVRVDTWTRGMKKEKRAKWIALQFPKYRMVKDTGLDIADAIGLCQWWIQRGNTPQTTTPARTSSRRTSPPRRKPGAGTLCATAT